MDLEQLRDLLLIRVRKVNQWGADEIVDDIISTLPYAKIVECAIGSDKQLRSLIAETKKRMNSEAHSPGREFPTLSLSSQSKAFSKGKPRSRSAPRSKRNSAEEHVLKNGSDPGIDTEKSSVTITPDMVPPVTHSPSSHSRRALDGEDLTGSACVSEGPFGPSTDKNLQSSSAPDDDVPENSAEEHELKNGSDPGIVTEKSSVTITSDMVSPVSHNPPSRSQRALDGEDLTGSACTSDGPFWPSTDKKLQSSSTPDDNVPVRVDAIPYPPSSSPLTVVPCHSYITRGVCHKVCPFSHGFKPLGRLEMDIRQFLQDKPSGVMIADLPPDYFERYRKSVLAKGWNWSSLLSLLNRLHTTKVLHERQEPCIILLEYAPSPRVRGSGSNKIYITSSDADSSFTAKHVCDYFRYSNSTEEHVLKSECAPGTVTEKRSVTITRDMASRVTHSPPSHSQRALEGEVVTGSPRLSDGSDGPSANEHVQDSIALLPDEEECFYNPI